MPLSGWEGGKQRNECKWRTNGAGYLATLGVTKCPSLAASLSPNPFEIRFREGYAPEEPIRMGLGRNALVAACSAT